MLNPITAALSLLLMNKRRFLAKHFPYIDERDHKHYSFHAKNFDLELIENTIEKLSKSNTEAYLCHEFKSEATLLELANVRNQVSGFRDISIDFWNNTDYIMHNKIRLERLEKIKKFVEMCQ